MYSGSIIQGVHNNVSNFYTRIFNSNPLEIPRRNMKRTNRWRICVFKFRSSSTKISWNNLFISTGMSSVKNMRDIYLLPREAMMEPPFAIPCSLKYVIALGKPQKTLFFSGQATKEGEVKAVLLRKKDFLEKLLF